AAGGSGFREGGPSLGSAQPGFGPGRYKAPGLGPKTAGPTLAQAQAQAFGTPTAPLGSGEATVPMAPPVPLAAAPPPAYGAPAARGAPEPPRPPAGPAAPSPAGAAPASPEARLPAPAGEETVIEDPPVLELADDSEPAEEGFLGRVALEGRLAQLEVLTGSRR